MAKRGLWMIPAVVLLGSAGALSVYAVTRPDAPPTVEVGQAGLGQYPQADFTLADGDGKGLVQAYCTACHSLAPIVTHGGFTAKQWAKEVGKMRTQHGAPIDDATAAQITAYLQKHYTAPPPPLKGTSGVVYSKPGN